MDEDRGRTPERTAIDDGADPRRRSTSRRRPRTAPGRGPVVLFVEDDAMLRYMVTAELTAAGYTVIEATTGEEAIDRLTGAATIDALLTDLRLPGPVDGWDVAEQARAMHSDLPVIYASAYGYATPRRVPSSLLLDKPYAPAALREALGELLD